MQRNSELCKPRTREVLGENNRSLKFSLNNECQYVGIINKNGRLEEEFYKKKLDLSAEKIEMFCMGLRLQMLMQNEFDEEFGSIKYSIIQRESSKFIVIPVFSHVIFLKLNKDASHEIFIEKIRKLIRDRNIDKEIVRENQ